MALTVCGRLGGRLVVERAAIRRSRARIGGRSSLRAGTWTMRMAMKGGQLLNEDEIGRRAAEIDASTAAIAGRGLAGSGDHLAPHMRGGAPSDGSENPRSQRSSYYRDPFSDAEDYTPFSARHSRTSSDVNAALSPASAPAVPFLASGPTNVAGSSTGPGTAAYDAAASASYSAPTLTLPRPVSQSTVTSWHPDGANVLPVSTARSDHSHGSQGTSSGSSTAGGGAVRTSAESFPPTAAAGFAPVRRSNSWWARFGRTPLRSSNTSLDNGPVSPTGSVRRLSFRLPGTGGSGGNTIMLDPRYSMEFRDPRQPPSVPLEAPKPLGPGGAVSRLQAIEESGNTPDGSPDSPENSKESSGSGGTHSSAIAAGVAALRAHHLGKRDSAGNRRVGRHSQHSTSSLGTTRTADSDMVEKMVGGHYQLVQRAGTPSQHEPSPTDASATSTINSEAERGDDHGARHGLGDFGDVVTSPTTMGDPRNPVMTGPRPPPPPPLRSKLKMSSVDFQNRVAEYERRAAEASTQIPGGPRLPPSPTESAAERREKRRRTATMLSSAEDPELPQTPSRTRWTVAERQSLFVANPDNRKRDNTDNTNSASTSAS